jgi:hypothetical protein
VNLIRDLPVVQGYSSLGSLVVSQSDGSLSLLRSRDGIMTVVENWHAHDYEPWISAWNYWDTNVIFSGTHPCQSAPPESHDTIDRRR